MLFYIRSLYELREIPLVSNLQENFRQMISQQEIRDQLGSLPSTNACTHTFHFRLLLMEYVQGHIELNWVQNKMIYKRLVPIQ